MTQTSVRPSGAWAGWVTFAAVMLLLLGALHAFQGFVAMFDDGFFVVERTDDLLLVDMTAWGVVMLVWGLLQIGAGLGLAQGRAWARWFAVVVVFVDVILQIGFLPAYPIWSAILILLDVIVIFALTVRWEEARAAM
jgi:Predicted membrane protein (DUF2127)